MARSASAIMATGATKEAKGQAKLKELEAAFKVADKDLAKAAKVREKAWAALDKQLKKLAPKPESGEQLA